jgi:hypothetical protein
MQSASGFTDSDAGRGDDDSGTQSHPSRVSRADVGRPEDP